MPDLLLDRSVSIILESNSIYIKVYSIDKEIL